MNDNIPITGQAGAEATFHRVPYGYDVEIQVRGIDLRDALDDEMPAYFVAVAIDRLIKILEDTPGRKPGTVPILLEVVRRQRLGKA